MAGDTFGDLNDFYGEDDPLVLVVAGRRYRVVPASGEVWLKLQAMSESVRGRKMHDGEEMIFDTEMFALSLGQDVFDDMLKRLTGKQVAIAGMTAWFWQTGNPEAAKAYWESAGKAQAASPSTSTNTAAASTSRTRASGSGTTSRPRSKNAGKPPAAGRAGRRSSATGA